MVVNKCGVFQFEPQNFSQHKVLNEKLLHELVLFCDHNLFYNTVGFKSFSQFPFKNQRQSTNFSFSNLFCTHPRKTECSIWSKIENFFLQSFFEIVTLFSSMMCLICFQFLLFKILQTFHPNKQLINIKKIKICAKNLVFNQLKCMFLNLSLNQYYKYKNIPQNIQEINKKNL